MVHLLHSYSFFLTAFVKVLTAEVSHLHAYSGLSLLGPAMSGHALSMHRLYALYLLSTAPMAISLPPYPTYMQSFDFRLLEFPEISLEEKSAIYNNHTAIHQSTHPPNYLNLTAQNLSCAGKILKKRKLCFIYLRNNILHHINERDMFMAD